jgi:branched-chain amino acid transport system permease protein
MDQSSSANPQPFDLGKSLKQAGFVGMVMFGLCVPIVAFRAEQNMSNELVLQPRWWMTLVFTALAMVGSFVLSLANHAKAQKGEKRNEGSLQTSLNQIMPRLVPLGFACVIAYPLVMLALNGPGGSIKWIDNFGIQILIYVMLGWGLNIVVGLAGLLDLGYVAFYAVGAYAYERPAGRFVGHHSRFSGLAVARGLSRDCHARFR